MNSKITVAVEMDYSKKSEGFREELERLKGDDRFEVKVLLGPDSPHSEMVSSAELSGVDYYILMGHRNVGPATLEGNDRLKWIGRFGAGFENVDIDACNKNGVILSNAPYGIREPVAELVLSYILALTTRLPFFNDYIRESSFRDKGKYMTRCIQGSTVGLIGCGGIGQTVARLVAPFSMRVIAYDPYVDRDAVKKLGVELLSLDEVLKSSDYVSLHVPLTDDTRGMLKEDHFRMMKPSAFFINTSRGGIYSDAVLAGILKEGVVAGAGIDVFEDEPDVDSNPLLKCRTAIVTPHIAGAANNTDAIRMVMKQNVDSVFHQVEGRLPDSIVNPEVLEGKVPEDKITPSFNPR
ncbi:hypothetical protein B4O97_02555 [Marispirochaeta aestuarii]|uniref:Hydroxyacid dehydrogenase n=1 Tax=Marispirochaeta aestuarii TaxID=1963862 RepID=A0A1Y1S2G1_9SPIO|nr:NAD(P)-dependent oxidoreductase [Marispirochaeta aestuarii]ORC37899.1 hypothetical protein B4O97_02555 [Marispirochaeta aestuarii]